MMLTNKTLKQQLASYLESFGLVTAAAHPEIRPIVVPHVRTLEWAGVASQCLNLVRRLRDTGALPPWPSPHFTGTLMHDTMLPRAPIVARPDTVVCNGRIRIIELNYDSGLGGVAQLAHLNVLYKRSKSYGRFEYADVAATYADFLRPLAHTGVVFIYTDKPVGQALVAIEFFVDAVERVLGIPCRAAHFEDVQTESSRVAGAAGFVFDVAWRLNWFEGSDERAVGFVNVIESLQHAGIRVISDSRDLGVEDKGTLAHLWSLVKCKHPDLTDEDTVMIKSAIPETVLLSPDADGETDLKRVASEQAQWVLKPLYGAGGEGVVVGPAVDKEDWVSAIEQSYNTDASYVAQKYIPCDPIEPYLYGVADVNAYPKGPWVLSPYILGSSTAGWLVRVLVDGIHQGVSGLKSGAQMGIVAIGESYD